MLLPIHPDTDKNTSITDAVPLTTLLNHANSWLSVLQFECKLEFDASKPLINSCTKCYFTLTVMNPLVFRI